MSKTHKALKGRNISVFLLLCLCRFTPAYAQEKNTDTLKEVNIYERHKKKISNDDKLNEFSPGQKILTIDSLTIQQYQSRSMQDLLAEQANVFMRSSGFNSLSTLNFRGSSAAQSLVLWNGVPIQNAAMGSTDISLLQVASFDKVNIAYGSSAALWGSGNVGGALLLESDAPVFSSKSAWKASMLLAAGSYSNLMYGLKLIGSYKKWYFSANTSGSMAKNDFTYKLNGTEQKMQNAALKGGGFILRSAYKINTQQTLNCYWWHQEYFRQIPAATFEQYSVKNHTDISNRFLLTWNNDAGHNKYYAKLAFNDDVLVYDDSSVLLHSNYDTRQLYAEAGWENRINTHHKFLLFTPVQLSWMQTNSGIQQQAKLAISGTYIYTFFSQKVDIGLNARAEIVDNNSILYRALTLHIIFASG